MIKYKILRISFFIPSGVTTVGGGVQRAPKYSVTTALCGLNAHQKIQKWARGPYQRWCCHPDETREYFYSNWISRKIPRSRLQISGSKTGYGLCLAQPTFRLASVCVHILLPLIIQLFPYYCLIGIHFTFILTQFAHQSFLVLLTLGMK